MMPRVFLIVLDSLGVGALPDAESFGDAGAHTLDHLAAAAGGLEVPRMQRLGLGCVPGVTALACPAQTGAHAWCFRDGVQALLASTPKRCGKPGSRGRCVATT